MSFLTVGMPRFFKPYTELIHEDNQESRVPGRNRVHEPHCRGADRCDAGALVVQQHVQCQRRYCHPHTDGRVIVVKPPRAQAEAQCPDRGCRRVADAVASHTCGAGCVAGRQGRISRERRHQQRRMRRAPHQPGPHSRHSLDIVHMGRQERDIPRRQQLFISESL